MTAALQFQPHLRRGSPVPQRFSVAQPIENGLRAAPFEPGLNRRNRNKPDDRLAAIGDYNLLAGSCGLDQLG
jgi:hypothetical protein